MYSPIVLTCWTIPKVCFVHPDFTDCMYPDETSSTLPSIFTVWTHLRSSRRSVQLHCSGPEYISSTIGSIRTLRRGRLPLSHYPLIWQLERTTSQRKDVKGRRRRLAVLCKWLKFCKIPWLFLKLPANQLRCLSNTEDLYSTHFRLDNPDLAFGLSLPLCFVSEEINRSIGSVIFCGTEECFWTCSSF